MLASACSIFWPTTAKLKTDKVNTHAGVYRYTVKCAYEDTYILAAHYGEYILHPVELPLHLSWFCISIVVVSMDPKTNRDNAFP